VESSRGSSHAWMGDVIRVLLSWLVATLALAVTGAILSGLSASSLGAYALAALAAGVVGAIVRPVLVDVAARLGWLAVLVVAIVGQAIILYLALELVPGIVTETFGAAVSAAWIASAVATLFSWITSAGTDQAFTATLVRRGRRRRAKLSDPDVDGVLFVQLDGVPLPVLDWALQSGQLPTISRWLRDGSHNLEEWTPQLPCTTPASQLGVLHGTVDGIPAFRWYDRELGRVVVANRPADASLIEGRASDGKGLLADDGVSVSNLFTGDAHRTAMTMSRLSVSRGSPQTRRAVAWYLARPDGFARSLTRTMVELIKERHQSARQRRRGTRPRCHRGWTFAVLRAVSNGVLRDLNTAVVCDEMLRGTRAIYVDYVDYDEIAHHAGMFRPESLAALEAVDSVLGSLEDVAEVAPRRYRFVVLSDHGQSQGSTFADLYGVDLASLCATLTAEDVRSVQEPVESWGRTESLLDDMTTGSGGPHVVEPAARRVRRKVDASVPRSSDEGLVVLGSGNLGLVYVPGPTRWSREEIDRRWPGLVPGLTAHPGVGFVAAMSENGPQVVGASGLRWLDDGWVEGIDPLSAFAPHAAENLRRAVCMDRAPDLYVNSVVDERTLEVAAFEPLVGSHGGLGGWQDRAVLLTPTALRPEPSHVHGADELHRVFVAMLRSLGHRVAIDDTAAGRPRSVSPHVSKE
jgi:uncharacterized membrane protein YvlD (DUF360 family)